MGSRRRRRGYIETLPSGSFRAVVYAGLDILTKRPHYIRETAATHDAAEVAMTKLLRQVDQQQAPKTSITVGEAIEQWLEVAKLADTTRVRNVDLVRMYINPHLGHVLAGKLDAELLERFYARLERCKDMCGRRPPKGHVCKGLSTSSTRKIHYIISGALGLAVRWNYLGVNPAELAHAPSPAKSKPDPPSTAEAAALLNEAWRDPEWGLLIWLTMVTGCRRGELCSLRWSDLDVEKATIWVQRSTSQTRLGLKQKETKSENRRRISLDAHTMGLLAEHHARVVEQLGQLGGTGDDETFMFSSRAGLLDAAAAELAHAAVPAHGPPAQAAQHPPARIAPLLRDRADICRCRPSHRRWPARSRQRWRDHAEGLRRLRRGCRPQGRRHDGRDSSQA